jgi:hypothetical protein
MILLVRDILLEGFLLTVLLVVRRMLLSMEHTSMSTAGEVRILEEMPPMPLTVIEGYVTRS